jgi:hypothetical protein
VVTVVDLRPSTAQVPNRALAMTSIEHVSQSREVANLLEPSELTVEGFLKPLQQRKNEIATYLAREEILPPSLGAKMRELLGQKRSMPTALLTRSSEDDTDPTPTRPSAQDFAATSAPLSESEAGFDLTGRLRFGGGLAVASNPPRFQLTRTKDGLEYERGSIDAEQGLFSINVGELEGELVAELVDQRGFVVGQGELNLAGIASTARRGLELVMMPVANGFRIGAVSAYGYRGRRMAVPGTRLDIVGFKDNLPVNAEGDFTDEMIAHESHALVRAGAREHWPTLGVVTGARSAPLRLFSNSYLNGLARYVYQEPADPERMAIVIGRVTKDGKPLAGARVELSRLGARPIYFDDFFPNIRRDETTENGEFAVVFFDVGEAVETLRVIYNQQVSLAETITIARGHVSEVAFELNSSRKVSFEALDVFNNRPIAGGVRLSVQGYEGETNLGPGRNAIDLETGSGLAEVYLDAGPRALPTRMMVSRRSRHVQVPVVEVEWLTRMTADQRISIGPDEGVVLGFVRHDDFEVRLPDDLKPAAQIVYFDSTGRPVQRGIAGGGFLVVGVPFGQHNFVVHGLNTGQRRLLKAFVDAVANPSEFIHFD